MATSRMPPPAVGDIVVSFPATGDIVISFEYEPESGVLWADMWDNHVLGWVSDLTTGIPAQPVVIGGLPDFPAIDTAPVVTPEWASVRGIEAIAPNQWRGPLYDLFTFLATNNGAQRKLRGNFADATVSNTWDRWAGDHADLVWNGDRGQP